MPTDFIGLFAVLTAARVRFVVVGGLAVLLHGLDRLTADVDLVIDLSTEAATDTVRALTAAGYRVWAPDQRGYNLSSKPAGVRPYDIDELARDVLGLIDATGHDKVYLVGHDWGAAVAWWVAGKYPERLHKLAILNVPHLAVMFRAMWRSWAQMRKSWYIFFFQIPRLPESSLRRNNWTNAIRALKGSARRGTFTPEDIEHHCAAWSQPGAITGMINCTERPAARSASSPAWAKSPCPR